MGHRKGKPPGGKPGGGTEKTGDVYGAFTYQYTPLQAACQVTCPVLHLLNWAAWLHLRALLDGDFTKAGKHRHIYLALLPLALQEVGR